MCHACMAVCVLFMHYMCIDVHMTGLFQMFEGKERRHQLIEELRTTHALQAPEQKIKKQEAEQIDKKKLQEKRLLHKVRATS